MIPEHISYCLAQVYIDMDVFYIEEHLLQERAALEAERTTVVEIHSQRDPDLPRVHVSRPPHRIIHDHMMNPMPSTSRQPDPIPALQLEQDPEPEIETVQMEEDEDTKYLDELERNIAAAARSLQTLEVVADVEPTDETRSQRLKNVGKKILR